MPKACFIAGLAASVNVARGRNAALTFQQGGVSISRTPIQVLNALVNVAPDMQCFHGIPGVYPRPVTWTTSMPAAVISTGTFGSDRIAYGNGVFATITPFAAVSGAYTSVDGITWTQRNQFISEDRLNMLFANNQFYAYDFASRTVRTSPDGITWTTQTDNIPSGAEVIQTDGTNFVLGTTSGNIYSATNGATFTQRRTAATFDFERIVGIAYGNGTFVATVRTNTTNRRGIWYSTNGGVSWTFVSATSQFGGNSLEEVVFANGRFLVNAGTGGVYSSTNAITWSAASLPSGFTSLSRLYAAGGFFFTSTDNTGFGSTATAGRIYTSLDSVTWTQGAAIGRLNYIAFGGGRYVASVTNLSGNAIAVANP